MTRDQTPREPAPGDQEVGDEDRLAAPAVAKVPLPRIHPEPPAAPFLPRGMALRRVLRRHRNAVMRLEYSGPSPTHTSGWAVWASLTR